MPKADKKQRHQAKRKAKRLESRRRESISPVKRFAQAIGPVEYWMSEGFDKLRQAQIFVYKTVGRQRGVACFLVDRGVVGLKDAWVRVDLYSDEFEKMLATAREHDIPMRRVSRDDVRPLIAGGIRWAHENGMRLPKDWAKAALLIDGIADRESADISAFVKEFVGHPEDLRRRIIGEPFDSYVQREDISFVFSDAAPFMDQQTGQYKNLPGFEIDEEALESSAADVPDEDFEVFAERFAAVATGLASETARRLAVIDKTPSSELFEAWISVLTAAFMSNLAMADATEAEAADLSGELLRDMRRRINPSRIVEYDRAVDQAFDYLEANPQMMFDAVAENP